MNEQNTQKSIIIFSAEKQIENKPPSISHTPPKRRGEKKTIGMHARLLYKIRPAKELENLVWGNKVLYGEARNFENVKHESWILKFGKRLSVSGLKTYRRGQKEAGTFCY